MKDEALDKLLRSAARARHSHNNQAATEAAAEPPFGFTTRVLAQWRSASGGSDRTAAAMVLWFRRAFFCSCAVAAASVTWSFHAAAPAASDEMAIVSYDASADLP